VCGKTVDKYFYRNVLSEAEDAWDLVLTEVWSNGSWFNKKKLH